jgi:hypothetical protein
VSKALLVLQDHKVSKVFKVFKVTQAQLDRLVLLARQVRKELKAMLGRQAHKE